MKLQPARPARSWFYEPYIIAEHEVTDEEFADEPVVLPEALTAQLEAVQAEARSDKRQRSPGKRNSRREPATAEQASDDRPVKTSEDDDFGSELDGTAEDATLSEGQAELKTPREDTSSANSSPADKSSQQTETAESARSPETSASKPAEAPSRNEDSTASATGDAADSSDSDGSSDNSGREKSPRRRNRRNRRNRSRKKKS